MERDNDIREAIELIGRELVLPPSRDQDDFIKAVAFAVNELIEKDFSRLLSLLYRLDIDEKKLRSLLKQHTNSDAGVLIADMILERQMQKIKSRREFSRDNHIDEEDKW